MSLLAGHLRDSCSGLSDTRVPDNAADYCGPGLGGGALGDMVVLPEEAMSFERAVLESLGWVAKGTAGILRKQKENAYGSLW